VSDPPPQDGRPPDDQRPFDPEREGELLSAYFDQELAPAAVARIESWLAAHPEGRREVERLRRLQEVTDTMILKDAPPEEWEAFFANVYNRAERGIAWFVLTLGAVVVGGYGLYEFVRGYFLEGHDPWWLKAGVFGICAGLLLLVVSLIRERFYTRKRSRYDQVIR
jgi:hypothetical protein